MARCLLVAFIVCAIVSLAQSCPVNPVNRSCETSILSLKAAVELTNEASVSKQIQLDTVWW